MTGQKFLCLISLEHFLNLEKEQKYMDLHFKSPPTAKGLTCRKEAEAKRETEWVFTQSLFLQLQFCCRLLCLTHHLQCGPRHLDPLCRFLLFNPHTLITQREEFKVEA